MNDDTTPMKTCTKCGQEFPATTEYFSVRNASSDGLRSTCKKCDALYRANNRDRRHEYNKQWKQNNPEQYNETRKKWVKDNPDKITKYTANGKERRVKYHKEWYEANKTKRLQQTHQYYEENKEWYAEYRKEWYEANKDESKFYVAEWRKNNPDKTRANKQRRRARKRNLPDTFTSEQWIACLEYFNYCCAVCGSQLRDLFGDVEPHADHWVPISYKGDDNPGTVAENMVCLCNHCNLSKQDKLPHVWLTERYGRKKATEILARIETYFDHVRNNQEDKSA